MITIASSLLSVDVLPDVGGKVAQISDSRSGHRFLVSPQKDCRTIPSGGDWLQHDTSGMDDCFPNIAAGLYPEKPWHDVHLPDLGEWTHGAWDVLNSSADQIVMVRAGVELPYSALKRIEFVNEDTLAFSYLVSNPSESPMRFLWSAHPLIVVDGDFELEFPGAQLSMRTFPADGRSYTWPLLDNLDLSREWITRGTSKKLFVTGLEEGWCSLRLSQHKLQFTFDLKTLPTVGLWFNHYAFPPWSDKQFCCIAVEPCTSPSDLLDELDANSYPVIPACGSAAWSMQLQITKLKTPKVNFWQ